MLGVLAGFKRRAALEKASYGLYRTAIEQARLPVFYRAFAVDDSVDGRFDLLTLHVYLILRRLRREEADGRDLGQRLFDLMFADMDNNLRIMGVSDMRVGKRVKAMAQAFYGRVSAYDLGFDGHAATAGTAMPDHSSGIAPGGDTEVTGACRTDDGFSEAGSSDDMLAEALHRNLYRGRESAPCMSMAAYVRHCDAALGGQSWADLVTGAVAFPQPDAGPEAGAEACAGTAGSKPFKAD